MATEASDFQIPLADQQRILNKRKVQIMSKSLSRMNRHELNEYAATVGIDTADQYETNATLIDAIEKREARADAVTGEEPTPETPQEAPESTESDDTPDSVSVPYESGQRVHVVAGDHEGHMAEVIDPTTDGYRVRVDGGETAVLTDDALSAVEQ